MSERSKHYDFLIIGSGFGGSLMALVLGRLGKRVLVIDSAKHPRFAIGESSTPLADSILRRLCQQYDLPALLPLTAYGTAKQELPQLTVGMKRGFSYFRHHENKPFDVSTDSCEQMVVAASATDELSDTHWLRSDVDAYFAEQLADSGIELRESAFVESIRRDEKWRVEFRQDERLYGITSDFIIDASGRAGVLLRHLGITRTAGDCLTNSRAIYAHFTGVTPWHEQFCKLGGDASLHPFRCDRAAVHHLIDDGWMWQLPFDNGVTSAGFVFKSAACRELESLTPDLRWKQIIERYPTLAEQFGSARTVTASSGIVATNRLQFIAEQFAGEGWACLPSTGGFIDPLHSTGIAHTMSAIERLAAIFSGVEIYKNLKPQDALIFYDRQVREEFRQIDRLVAICYEALDDFENFVAATMLYFASVITTEHRRTHPDAFATPASRFELAFSFLLARDPYMCQSVQEALDMLKNHDAESRGENAFPQVVKSLIEPYNQFGLCDESVNNMYRYTVAPEKS